MRLRRWLVLGSCVAWGLACGSRTGLIVPEEEDGDAEVPVADAGAVRDARGVDATEPPVPDARPPMDARDAPDVVDALPALDVVAKPPPNDCPDAAATLVYLITQSATLLSFYPPTATFRTIGTIRCPVTRPLPANVQNTPNSMAVDHLGIAYVGYQNGELFRVSTATASCQATTFVPGQDGFSPTFGMGYAASDGGETLYVAEIGDASRLATIDTKSFALNVVGPFAPAIVADPELTGTGGGDLFVFFRVDAGSAIANVDRASAKLLQQSTLNGVFQGVGWAFAFWGGDFYTFTSPTATSVTGNGTLVRRFRPSDGTVVSITSYPDLIVGAGVSTCAPQQ